MLIRPTDTHVQYREAFYRSQALAVVMVESQEVKTHAKVQPKKINSAKSSPNSKTLEVGKNQLAGDMQLIG